MVCLWCGYGSGLVHCLMRASAILSLWSRNSQEASLHLWSSCALRGHRSDPGDDGSWFRPIPVREAWEGLLVLPCRSGAALSPRGCSRRMGSGRCAFSEPERAQPDALRLPHQARCCRGRESEKDRLNSLSAAEVAWLGSIAQPEPFGKRTERGARKTAVTGW